MVVALQHGGVSGRAAHSAVGRQSTADLRHPETDERIVVLCASDVLQAILSDVLAIKVCKGVDGHAMGLHHGTVDAAADRMDGLRCYLLLLGFCQLGVVRQSAQGVGIDIVDPGFVLKGELVCGKGCKPAMTSGVKLGRREDIGQLVAVSVDREIRAAGRTFTEEEAIMCYAV